MHSYSAYGLRLESQEPLKYLPIFNNSRPHTNTITVLFSKQLPVELRGHDGWDRIENHSNSALANAAIDRSSKIWRKRQWTKISYHRDCDSKLTFYISALDNKIVCQRSTEIPFDDAESFLIGPVLGCLHRLKNNFCLHASVLSYKGSAFALVGAKGAGKSTTSAALLQAGAKLVSDDVAVVDFSTPNLTVASGYPAVRLLPKSLMPYCTDLDMWPDVLSVGEKKIIPIPNQHLSWDFDPIARPLKCIYVLQPRSDVNSHTEISNLPAAKSIVELAPHAFARYITVADAKIREFYHLGEITKSIPIRSLTCTNNIDDISDASSYILANFIGARK